MTNKKPAKKAAAKAVVKVEVPEIEADIKIVTESVEVEGQKSYGVVFVAQEPVERKGVYKASGSFEDAKSALIGELDKAFGNGKYEIKVFQLLPDEPAITPEQEKPNGRAIN